MGAPAPALAGIFRSDTQLRMLGELAAGPVTVGHRNLSGLATTPRSGRSWAEGSSPTPIHRRCDPQLEVQSSTSRRKQLPQHHNQAPLHVLHVAEELR